MRLNQRKICKWALIRWNGCQLVKEGFKVLAIFRQTARERNVILAILWVGLRGNQLTWMSSLKIALCFLFKNSWVDRLDFALCLLFKNSWVAWLDLFYLIPPIQVLSRSRAQIAIIRQNTIIWPARTMLAQDQSELRNNPDFSELPERRCRIWWPAMQKSILHLGLRVHLLLMVTVKSLSRSVLDQQDCHCLMLCLERR